MSEYLISCIFRHSSYTCGRSLISSRNRWLFRLMLII